MKTVMYRVFSTQRYIICRIFSYFLSGILDVKTYTITKELYMYMSI